MDKSPIQARAENLVGRFRASGRPTFVVEFAGLPKAGKTTTLNQVYAFLRRCGFRCEVVVERASVCPIRDKKHFNFNIWTVCTTLSHLLAATQSPPRQDDPDILFLDRGIFDSICWLSVLERLARITEEDRSKVEEFLLIDDWTARVSGVIVMTADPNEALEREQGYLPVVGPGGSIMNPSVLRQMKTVIEDTTNKFRDRFKFLSLDTSSAQYLRKQPETCHAAADKILDWMEESIEEHILSVEKAALPELSAKFVLNGTQAAKLLETFETKGSFAPRNAVEADSGRIQPLPVVVVRNQSGDILRLIRRERETSNPLDKKMTVWAGGHVRREDSTQGKSPVLVGAIRELQEELRLYVKAEDLRLIGAVYSASGASTQKHLAFVYEWRAETDDVQVALCNAEFVEKSGNSLSGTFLSPAQIMQEARNDELKEEWSIAILDDLLGQANT